MGLYALGNNIKKYRKKYNLTQAQLAEKLFVSYQGVSSWERGVTVPDLENVCKLAELFHVTIDVLMREETFPNERLMIGIDGGGTKTEFVLFSESGKILCRTCLTQSNPNEIGLKKSCEILAEGIDFLMEGVPEVKGIFAGIAGATSGDNCQKITEYLKNRYKAIKIDVNTDAVNVISCNTQSSDSMALVCGTGSVLFARENGIMHRIGGWGYLFDEEGSAYSIGRDAIRATLAQSDGLGGKTLIADILKEELKCDIWDCLNEIYQKGKAYIASLAPIVFKAAKSGDMIAKQIIQKNAIYLAKLINAAKEQYNCGNNVVACGGLIENCREILMPIIEEHISCDVKFIFPCLPPVYGACVECCRMMNIVQDDGFQDTFYNEYNNIRK